MKVHPFPSVTVYAHISLPFLSNCLIYLLQFTQHNGRFVLLHTMTNSISYLFTSTLSVQKLFSSLSLATVPVNYRGILCHLQQTKFIKQVGTIKPLKRMLKKGYINFASQVPTASWLHKLQQVS